MAVYQYDSSIRSYVFNGLKLNCIIVLLLGGEINWTCLVPSEKKLAAAITQFVNVELVIEWLLTRGSILKLAMRYCVVGRDNTYCPFGQAVYPSWNPNLTNDLQTEPKKGCLALAWLD